MTEAKKRFGRLTLIERVDGLRWRMACDCGAETVVWAGNVRAGRTTSCGCRQVECARALKNQTTHGMSGTPTYSSWAAMRARCQSPSAGNWARYGGRGIAICKRWASFENFLSDMGPRPSLRHSIDRYPDRDGNYEPANCRWATPTEQANNHAGLHLIEFHGSTKSVAAWAEDLGLKESTLRSRILKGWPVERALSAPARRKSQ